MSANRLPLIATQWRDALNRRSTVALMGAAGTALVVALVVAASLAGVPQHVVLPQWWGAWPTGDQARPGWGAAAVAVIAALCVVWVHLARTWLRAGARVPRLRTIGLVAVAWATPLTLAGPIGSLDVQSYAAVGRLAQVGMNPYHWGPAWLHDSFAAAVSDEWQYTPTPYGPLQVSLLREIAVGAGNHVGLAVLMIRAVAVIGLAAAVVLALHAAQNGERSSVLLLVALNPLVLVHIVSGAHLDVLVGALAVAVVLLVRRRMPVFAMVVAVIACMLKLPGLLLVGYVGLDVLRRTDRTALRGRLVELAGAATATVVVTLAVVPDAFGWVGALAVPGRIRSGLAPSTWLSWLIAGVAGVSDPHGVAVATTIARVLTAAVGAALAARLLWYATDGPERAAYAGVGWAMMVLAFSGPTTYPWYLTWGLFAAAVGSRLRGRLVLLALSVAYALLGGYAGGTVGILVMVAMFAVTGVVLWRTWLGLVVTPVTERALASAAVA
ncbi:MAG TPA: polyprenol phosphomannose-dependent alpha 1,6 mannosyltransferase MptB [Cellulomonas sp.]